MIVNELTTTNAIINRNDEIKLKNEHYVHSKQGVKMAYLILTAYVLIFFTRRRFFS